MKIAFRFSTPRPSTPAPAGPRGLSLRAGAAGVLLIAVAACDSPGERSAWERAGRTTEEAVESAKRVASQRAEEGWKAVQDGSGKAWDKTKDLSAATVEEAKKTAERLKETVAGE